MFRNSTALRTVVMTAGLMAVLGFSGAAAAQMYDELGPGYYSDPSGIPSTSHPSKTTFTKTTFTSPANREEFVVTTPRPSGAIVGRTSRGFPIREMSLSQRVSTAGLDHLGIERRVKEVANDACHELDMRKLDNMSFPLTTHKACVKDAVQTSMSQISFVSLP